MLFLYIRRTISVSNFAESEEVIVCRDLNPLIVHEMNGALKVFPQSTMHGPRSINVNMEYDKKS